jgi:deazaflavin-dependent oxidoreductase (nitroreductase family)
MNHQETAPASRNQERVVAEFRANGGRVGGYHDGMPLLLLTTTGGKTGRRRATPLTYLPDGDRYVVAAAAGGTPGDPAWYRNLVAHPDVTVEVGTDVFAATVTTASGAERDDLFDRCVDVYPQLADYASRTTREIPMVIITRSA